MERSHHLLKAHLNPRLDEVLLGLVRRAKYLQATASKYPCLKFNFSIHKLPFVLQILTKLWDYQRKVCWDQFCSELHNKYRYIGSSADHVTEKVYLEPYCIAGKYK